MGGGVPQGGGGGKEKKGSLAPKRKKKKRVGFVLDLAPLVDIAFLLLTFFMFTTTMMQPQVMEMNIPPELDVNVEVAQSSLLTVYVRNDNKLFYRLGEGAMAPLKIDELKGLAVSKNLEVKNQLITALKIQPEAKYEMLVNILDELNVAEIDITQQLAQEGLKRKRKFSIGKLLEEEEEELKSL